MAFISGVNVIANIWGICHEEAAFKDAHKFKANRFIDSNGNFQKPDSVTFIPFSSGK